MTSPAGTVCPPSVAMKLTSVLAAVLRLLASTVPLLSWTTFTVQPRAEPKELEKNGSEPRERGERAATGVSPLHLLHLLLHRVDRLVQGNLHHVAAAQPALYRHLQHSRGTTSQMLSGVSEGDQEVGCSSSGS